MEIRARCTLPDIRDGSPRLSKSRVWKSIRNMQPSRAVLGEAKPGNPSQHRGREANAQLPRAVNGDENVSPTVSYETSDVVSPKSSKMANLNIDILIILSSLSRSVGAVEIRIHLFGRMGRGGRRAQAGATQTPSNS